MKYEKEKALLRKTAEIIQNYEKRMSDLTGLEKKLDTDVGNE